LVNRKIPICILVLVLALPTLAQALTINFGASLDALFPGDPDAYGDRMIGNDWGKQIRDKDFSTGSGRADFVSPNRTTFLLAPVLVQSVETDSGVTIEMTQSVNYLFYSPTKELDVTFERFNVPLRLGARYTFMRERRFRPQIGAGGSLHYVVTRIAGKDLFSQKIDPDFVDELSPTEQQYHPDGDFEYETMQHEWALSGWYGGWYALIGAQVGFNEKLALSFAVRYESVRIRTLDAALDAESEDVWTWKKREFNAEAGGVTGSVGILYSF
jgi:hypothetical protein